MKLIIALFFFIFTQAYAHEICRFNEVHEFTAVKKATKTQRAVSRMTFVEKNLVHRAVTLQSYLSGVSKEEALKNFAEADGEILHYTINGKNYALVHYYPGDNEFGGFFEVTGNAFKLIAEINDSYISCRN